MLIQQAVEFNPVFVPDLRFSYGFSYLPPGTYPSLVGPDISGDPAQQAVVRFAVHNWRNTPNDRGCIDYAGAIIKVTRVSGRFLDLAHNGTVTLSAQTELPLPPDSVNVASNFTNGSFLLQAPSNPPPWYRAGPQNGDPNFVPYLYIMNVSFSFIPRWTNRDTVFVGGVPVGPYRIGLSVPFKISAIVGGFNTDWVNEPPPTAAPTTTTPFEAFVYDGEPPQVEFASKIGLYSSGGVHKPVYKPTPDARFAPELSSWVDTIGWNFESNETGDNPPAGTVDGAPAITPPSVTPVLAFDHQTFHACTGDIAKAPSDFVGYLYHTDDTRRTELNPPAGSIYPFYLTERTP